MDSCAGFGVAETPNSQISTTPETPASGGGKPQQQQDGSPHPSFDDLPQDLMEILNLSPGCPEAAPQESNPEPPNPTCLPAPQGKEISLSSSPDMSGSPLKPYSPFQTRTQILGSPLKPDRTLGGRKIPSPPRARVPNPAGKIAPPNPPSEGPNFSLFTHGSLHSVSSAKIPAEYPREAERAAEKEGAAAVAGAVLEEAVAQPEFTFPKLGPSLHPTLSWT